MSDQKMIDRMLDEVEWRPVEGAGATDELHATHEGVLRVGDARFRCYQLNDGSRVLNADDVASFFGVSNGR